MDRWFWLGLLALAALVTLVVIFFLPEKGPPVPGEVLRRGQFRLTQGENPLGEEAFRWAHTEDGEHRLSSQVTLTLPGQRITMAFRLRLSPELEPLSYAVEVRTPQGVQRVGAEVGGNRAQMWVQAGPQRQEVTVRSDEPFLLFDNNQAGQALVLYEKVKGLTPGERARFRALVPQVLKAYPLAVTFQGPVALSAQGTPVEAQAYDLAFEGGVSLRLFVREGEVIALHVPSQRAWSVRSDRFPQGLALARADSGEPTGLREVEVRFPSGELALAGTLALPAQGIGPFPAVLLVPGSGPVDRDENAPGLPADVLRQLAHHLARNGIASLRYDKRGVGQSQGTFRTAGFYDLVGDARAALAFLKGRQEVDPRRLFVLGHSEGGRIAPEVAPTAPELAGLILVAGTARPLDEIIRWQVETLNRRAGVGEAQLRALLKRQDQWAAWVKRSQGDWADNPFESVRQALPWVTPAQYEGWQRTSLRWLREHFTADPREALRRVTVPVLILHGEKDAQVPSSEAERIAEALRAVGNERVALHVLADLNHLLRPHPEVPNLEERHLDQPVNARVLELIVDWIRGQVRG